MSAKRRALVLTFPVVAAFSLSACMTDSRTQILASDTSQVQLRAVQTRVFDTGDRAMVFRSVLATLQDLGFVVDKADDTLYLASATKLGGYVLRMTVLVQPRGPRQTAVRASAQYDLVAVTDAAPYQQFFDALEKAMFLTANKIE